MVELRVLCPDDWRLWRELRLQALTDAPEAFGSTLGSWQGQGDREERWRGRLSIPGARDVVALVDGAAVGMVTGVPRPPGVELISMWVSRAARGQGVGDALVDDVVAWARDAGAAVVHLAVAEGNDAAYLLYQRHGFRLTGELGDVMPDGVRRERLMLLDLADPA